MSSVEALNTLRDIFQNTKKEEKAKMTFFMILNTDLPVIENLKTDEIVGLFTDVTPLIQKNYLVDFIYELQLQSYFAEVIEDCPSALTIPLIEVVVNKLKQPTFHKDEYGIKHLYQLWSAIFVRILKIDKFFVIDNLSGKLFYYFKELYDLIQNILVTSLNVSGEKFTKFSGNHCCCMFEVIKRIINLWTEEDLVFPVRDIYNLSIELLDKYDDKLTNPSEMCLIEISLGIPKILECLSIETWMSWAEFYSDSDSEFSIQRKIGENIYHICEKINNLKLPESMKKILTCLSSLRIKPRDEFEEMKIASIEDVINNINKGKKNWFKALLMFDIIEEKTLECIEKHLDFADDEDVSVILNKALGYLFDESSEKGLEDVKKLFFSAIKKVPEKDHPLWLEKVFCSNNYNVMRNPDSVDELTQVFNKISAKKNVNSCDLLCLCMQAPEETLLKLCSFGVCNSKEVDFSVSVLSKLKHVCGLPCMSEQSTKELTMLGVVLLELINFGLNEKDKKAFISFVVHLEREGLIGWNFLKEFLELVRKNLEDEQLDKVNFYLEALKSFVGLQSFKGHRPTFLVFLSQVLGHLSWDLWSYSNAKVKGRELLGCLISRVLTQLPDENVSALSWAREEISKSWEVNQAYFCDLWFQYGLQWNGSKKFYTSLLTLTHTHYEHNTVRKFLVEFYSEEESWKFKTSIILSLINLLPVFTFSEWNSLFNHLKNVLGEITPDKSKLDVNQDVLYLFSSALYFLSEMLNENMISYQCYVYCLRCFGRLVNFLVSENKYKNFIEVFERIIFCFQVIEDRKKRESCSVILSPIFVDWVDKIKKTEEWKSKEEEIKILLEVLDVNDVTEAVNKKILN